MNTQINDNDSYQSLLLMQELAKEEPVSQRHLSRRLGIAVGLVNSYMKNMVKKGYVRVVSFPRNRYHYLLTPSGIAEKTRLTYRHLYYFTNLYATARKDFRELFLALESKGIKEIVFCGVDEVAEIAYLSLKETGIRLGAVLDDEEAGGSYFSEKVREISREELKNRHVVITSVKKRDALMEKLITAGCNPEFIYAAGDVI